jgi:hypothetical protein
MTRTTSAALALLCAAAPATAQTLAPRDTAHVGPAGSGGVGIFNPLTYTPTAGVELSTYPLAALIAPNGAMRAHLYTAEDAPLTLSWELGASLPSAAFLSGPPLGLAGYVTPSCKVHAAEPDRAPNDCQRPGAVFAPSLGLAASWGRDDVLTAKVDYTYGFLLSGERGTPLDTWAPLNLLFAPVFDTWRAHLGVRYDHALLPGWRVAAEAHLYRVARGPVPGRDPHTFVAHLGTDLRTTTHTRLTFGAMYWNSDQRAVEVEPDADGYSRFVHVRSHDFGPTLDFLWRWGD